MISYIHLNSWQVYNVSFQPYSPPPHQLLIVPLPLFFLSWSTTWQTTDLHDAPVHFKHINTQVYYNSWFFQSNSLFVIFFLQYRTQMFFVNVLHPYNYCILATATRSTPQLPDAASILRFPVAIPGKAIPSLPYCVHTLPLQPPIRQRYLYSIQGWYNVFNYPLWNLYLRIFSSNTLPINSHLHNSIMPRAYCPLYFQLILYMIKLCMWDTSVNIYHKFIFI